MQKFKSVLSLSQTREQLGLNDNEIVVYVKCGYLHPVIKFGTDNDGNILCEDFFYVKHERIAFFEYGINNFSGEICFDCREVQALRDKRLDLDKVGNHCPDVKPDPDYVPVWERASAYEYDPWGQRPRTIDPAQIPMAPKPPMPMAQAQAHKPPTPSPAPTPLSSPIGGQSEAQDNARVAELERQLDGKALPQDQDALEKTRKALEAEKASHARARKELEEKIKRLERLEKAIGMPEDWTQATQRRYPPVVRFVGYRLQGMDRDRIAAVFDSERTKGKRNGKIGDVECFTQSQIDALLTEDPIEELSIPQIGVLVDEGGPKAAESYKISGKRAINRGLEKSVPPDSQ